MLPLQARVDLRAMAINGYSAFPKAPALLEPHHQIVISRTLEEVLLLSSLCILQPQPTAPLQTWYTMHNMQCIHLLFVSNDSQYFLYKLYKSFFFWVISFFKKIFKVSYANNTPYFLSSLISESIDRNMVILDGFFFKFAHWIRIRNVNF